MNNFYDRICEWLNLHPITTGGFMALILTTMRVAMSENKKSFGYVCLEAFSCGLLSMAFSSSAIGLLHCDPSVAVLIGATAGFIGVDRLKVLIIKILDNWIEKHDPNND